MHPQAQTETSSTAGELLKLLRSASSAAVVGHWSACISRTLFTQIEAKADLNQIDDNRKSALLFAIERSLPDMACQLIDAGQSTLVAGHGMSAH